MFFVVIFAAALSKPEASELGSSLIGKRWHYRGIQSLFLINVRNWGYARLKDLGCAMDLQGIVVKCDGRFRMRSRLARNCGYAGMGDLECAVDYHVLSSYTDFQLQFK